MRRLAWIPCAVLLLTACQKVGPTFNDAPGETIDAAVDVPVGPASITVLRETNETNTGMPVAGTKVFFIKPDGTSELVMTGADGKASADVVPGSVILTVRQYNSAGTVGYHLVAFAGMEPGSDVIAGPGLPGSAPTSAGRITFTTPVFTGGTSYEFSIPCTSLISQNGTSTVRDLAANCDGSAAATGAVKVFGANGLVAYSVEQNMNLPALVNMTHALPAYQSPATAMMNLTGIPNTITSASVEFHLRENGFEYSRMTASSSVSGPTMTLSGPIAPVGSRTAVRAQFASGTLMPLVHLQRTMSQQLTSSLDVGGTAIPFVTRPTFDAGSLTAAWTSVGGAAGHTPDLIVARGNYFLRASGNSVDFTIIAPAVVDHATIPKLPAAISNLQPQSGDTGNVFELYLIDSVGKSFSDVVPHADAEARNMLFNLEAFPQQAELWFTAMPVA